MSTEITKASKYAEYLRKSTDDKEKQILSLSSQRDVLDRLKGSINALVLETIEEKKSAKKPGRPGFGRLVELIKEGAIDGIITWSPHRLFRNSVDMGTIIDLFDRGLLKEVITDGYTYRRSPNDLFLLGFQGLQAKFENDNKANDVKTGMGKCAALGMYPGYPPLGYLPDKHGIKGARKRDVDPKTFPLVRKIWDLMLRGTHSPKEILRIATDDWGLRSRNGKKLYKSRFYHMLNNPFYYGEYEWPRKSGNWCKGTHTPMITKEEFDRVQRMIGTTGRARPSKHYFTYGSCLLHCGTCGGAISGFEKVKRQKNGNVHRYEYYYCSRQKRGKTCTEHPVTLHALESQIEALLKDLWIPESVLPYVKKELETANESQFKDAYIEHSLSLLQLEALNKKLSNLIDMCANGAIDQAQFEAKKGEIELERQKLNAVINGADLGVAFKLEQAAKKLSFSKQLLEAYTNGSPEAKRGILVALCTDLRLSDKKLDLSSEKWIYPVKEIAKRLRPLETMYEPVLPLQNKVKIDKLIKSDYLCSLLVEVLNSFGSGVEKKLPLC